MRWIWEKKNWPSFYWDEVKILTVCNKIHYQLGILTAKCGNKIEPCSNEIIINTGRIELFSEKIKLAD